MVIIRKAKHSELSRIKYITKLAYKTPYKKGTLVTKPHESIEEKNKFANKEIFILVAIINYKIIGAVRYKFIKPNELYFFKLAVLKTYRSHGVGAALINKLEKIAQKNKCKKISLDCLQEKRLDEYYKKFGYKTDKIKIKNNHHAVIMSKSIKCKIF